MTGKSDLEVVELAVSRNLILLTLDLEFGQRYYFETQPATGVIVVRAKPAKPENVNSALKKFLVSELHEKHRLEGCLTIISKSKVRIIEK